MSMLQRSTKGRREGWAAKPDVGTLALSFGDARPRYEPDRVDPERGGVARRRRNANPVLARASGTRMLVTGHPVGEIVGCGKGGNGGRIRARRCESIRTEGMTVRQRRGAEVEDDENERDERSLPCPNG